MTIEEQLLIVNNLTVRAKNAPMLAVKPTLEKLADEQLTLAQMFADELRTLKSEINHLNRVG